MDIYLVQLSHTDIGYTDSQSIVSMAHAEFIDQAIDIADRTRDWPETCRFRWTVETGWALRQFVEQRPARVEALIKAVRRGQIELAGAYLHFSDAITPQMLLMSTRWLKEFCSSYGLSLRDAVHNDVNGYSWALPDAFNSVGVRRLAMALNETTSICPMPRHTVFRWQSPSGAELLVYFGAHYNEGNYLGLASDVQLPLGATWPEPADHATAEELFERSVPRVRDWAKRIRDAKHPYEAIMIQCGGYQADNSPPSVRPAQIARLWAERNPVDGVTVRTATLAEFFDALESEIAGHKLPIATHRAAWPDYWAFGLGSLPTEVSMLREAQATLAALEDTSSSNVLFGPAVQATLLAAEHTFDSWNSVFEPDAPESVAQWSAKRLLFADAVYLSRRLARFELDKIIRSGTPTEAIALFDPAASPDRQPVATIELPWDVTIDQPALQCPDGTTIPLREIEGGGFARRFEAVIPSLPKGGLLVKLIAGDSTKIEKTSGNMLENAFFRVEIDPRSGTIASLLDVRDGRMISDVRDAVAFGQWLHEDRPNLDRSTFGPMDKLKGAILHDPRTEDEQRLVETNEPLRATAFPAGSAYVARGPVFDEISQPLVALAYGDLTLSIRLYHKMPIVMVTYTGERLAVHHANADYITFPFEATPATRLKIDQSGGVFTPYVEQIPGTCLDFYTVHRWARLDDDRRTLMLAPLDAPLLCVGKPSILGFRRTLHPDLATLVSNVYNNYWYTNFPNTVPGTTRSRYLIASLSADASDAELSRLVDTFRIRAIGRSTAFKPIPTPRPFLNKRRGS